MKKLFHWLDENILLLLSGFLLVFIPLYPKWPLFDAIPGYIVRVRLEDFFVALTLGVFLIQLLRRKLNLGWSLPVKGLIIYLIVGLLSVLTAIFILQSVPLEYRHAGKTFLHWLRRLEYFTLFFAMVASLRSLRTVKTLVIIFFLVLTGVIVYGYGQKYLYWPAFSTMNREFSKGWWLYLTEHARVLSTFGGHYDLAGYLVIALSLAWSFFFGVRSKLAKLGLGLLIASGFWLLILTASRISFAAYLVGVTGVLFLWSFRHNFNWFVKHWLLIIFASILIMLSFGDLSERFLHLFHMDERIAGIKAVLLHPSVPPPNNQAAFLVNNITDVTSKSDTPPTPKSSPIPSDVTGNLPPLLIPTKTASGSTILVEKKRVYSPNAVLFDLSTGIRLDATWPKAIAGFKTDPLFGEGYATLTKNFTFEFTEAESTDNDYLRALGETGLAGFLAFFGTIILMIWIALKSLSGIKDNYYYALAVGFISLTVGLLLNALLIDIFEASKVAYVYWSVAGLSLGTLHLLSDRIKKDHQPMRLNFSLKTTLANFKKFFLSDLFLVGIISILCFSLRTYKLDNPIADWHSWRQADTSAVTRNFIKNDGINWLYPTYDDLSSIASGKPNLQGLRFVEFPIYNAATVFVKKIIPELNVESAGRVTTDIFSVLSLIFLFLLTKRLLSRRIAYLTAITFAVLPYGIYYWRTTLPDPSMVAMALGAQWFFSQYLEWKKIRYLLLGIIFAALALLIKPFAAFLLIPIGYLWWRKFGFQPKGLLILSIAAFVSLVPFVLWRLWMMPYPQGIPANNWLFNGDGIRFKGAFWYWIFADRIGRLILGYWGVILLALGMVRKIEGKFNLYPLIFFSSSVLYLIVVATGNVRHDYYQILIIPSLTILVGIGLDFLLFNQNPIFNNLISKFLGLASFLFMVAFSWYFVKDYFNINHPEIVEAGSAVDQLTNIHAKVVAPYGGDTAFLYQTNRAGWPIVENSIDYLIANGADYYVSVNIDDFTKNLMKQAITQEQKKLYLSKGRLLPPYTVIKYTDHFIIIQLVPDNKLPRN